MLQLKNKLKQLLNPSVIHGSWLTTQAARLLLPISDQRIGLVAVNHESTMEAVSTVDATHGKENVLLVCIPAFSLSQYCCAALRQRSACRP
jgi:hypothetical protein